MQKRLPKGSRFFDVQSIVKRQMGTTAAGTLRNFLSTARQLLIESQTRFSFLI
jgi:hypothetical protein